jgi:hypothetical protein
MKAPVARFRNAERLDEITQRIGYALWQLQELEHVSATYFVLLAKATPGMGLEAGEDLVVKAQGETFGQTISKLRAANLVSDELETRVLGLLRERNWLVHASRSDSHGAVHANATFESLKLRLDKLAEAALALLLEIGALAERHMIAHKVSQQEIDVGATALLESWRESDAI